MLSRSLDVLAVWCAPLPVRVGLAATRRLLVGVALVLALPSSATSMPERTAGDVAAESDLVVEATAMTARAAWVGGRIITFTELRVERTLRSTRARAPATITVALPGGEIGGIGQRVAGTPRLLVGGRYLLCLSAEVLAGARTVVGLWQGAWRVADSGAVRAFTHDGPAPDLLSRVALERDLAGAP